ncbi:MAG: hypothetical protein JJU45_00750 [Acidimicrobiia bacterium]|nr:hypothetical protein [Acidimicrobiia bacterium]
MTRLQRSRSTFPQRSVAVTISSRSLSDSPGAKMRIVVRQMEASDFGWAAALMQQRREHYAGFSPVLWRPATGVVDIHARFMEAAAASEDAVALRTDHGFVLAIPQDGRFFVDDFAVDDDMLWSTDGQELLMACWRAARSSGQSVVRVVTARRDEPKRTMLSEAGLAVVARWWVKELTPQGEPATWGPVTMGDVEALVVPAPPVYDPGGPVCALGDVEPERAIVAAEAAARAGAVLAIVARDGSPGDAPAAEPHLEAAGFHNPSEFYEGAPT